MAESESAAGLVAKISMLGLNIGSAMLNARAPRMDAHHWPKTLSHSRQGGGDAAPSCLVRTGAEADAGHA